MHPFFLFSFFVLVVVVVDLSLCSGGTLKKRQERWERDRKQGEDTVNCLRADLNRGLCNSLIAQLSELYQDLRTYCFDCYSANLGLLQVTMGVIAQKKGNVLYITCYFFKSNTCRYLWLPGQIGTVQVDMKCYCSSLL